MKPLKYRPSLSAQEIADCVNALEQYSSASTALKVLRVFLFKQSQDMVVPTNNTAPLLSNVINDRDLPADQQLSELQRYEKQLLDAAKQRGAMQSGGSSYHGTNHDLIIVDEL